MEVREALEVLEVWEVTVILRGLIGLGAILCCGSGPR
jgi:hypothetical protein